MRGVGKPYRRDELPLHPVRALQPFEKCAFSFPSFVGKELCTLYDVLFEYV